MKLHFTIYVATKHKPSLLLLLFNIIIFISFNEEEFKIWKK